MIVIYISRVVNISNLLVSTVVFFAHRGFRRLATGRLRICIFLFDNNFAILLQINRALSQVSNALPLNFQSTPITTWPVANLINILRS